MPYKYTKMITIGYKPNGTRVRKRFYSNSKTDLERQIRSATVEVKEFPQTQVSPSITFKKYAESWLDIYKVSKEAATKEMYRVALRKTKDIDDMPMNEIRQSDLQRILRNHSDRPNACVKMRLVFRQIWACAVEEGICPSDITKRLEVPFTCVKQQRALTEPEKTAIKEADLDQMERMYVSLLFYLGLRPQEALALMPSDFKDGTVTIQRAVGYNGNKPYIKPTKTHNIRILPVPDALQSLLDSYQTDTYLIHKNSHLMLKHVKSDFWLKIKSKIEAKLGHQTDLHPYTFRHNYCTMCYYSHISLKKCQYLLGHSSAQMIMKVYAHLDDSKESLDFLKTLKM